jgi:CRP-like cAMP-binding protein
MAGDPCSSDLPSALEQQCEKLTRPKCTVLFRQGEKASGMFVLFSGKVTLGFELDTPERSCGPGALMGFYSAITGHNYGMTATVTEDAELGFLSRQTLGSLLHEHPELCEQLLTILSEGKPMLMK